MSRICPFTLGVAALLAACAGDSPCVEEGKARCAAICECSARAECVVTSSDGLELAQLYVDQHDCEVVAELECVASDDVAPYPECAAALPAATCATVYEADDTEMEVPLGGLVLPEVCR